MALSRTSLIQYFRSLGYRKIGHGVDATVFQRENTSVLKIMEQSPTIKMTDDLYTYKPIQSIHTPRLIKRSEYEIAKTKYVGYEIEFLKPIKAKTLIQCIIWAMEDAIPRNLTYKQFLDEISNESFWLTFEYKDWAIKNSTKLTAYEKQIYEKFYKEAQKLYKHGKRKGWYWDFHTENVMLRGNVPVITDPWTS